jgi:hypothetical protein
MLEPINTERQSRKTMRRPYLSERGPQSIGAYQKISPDIDDLEHDLHKPCITKYTVTVWFISSIVFPNFSARRGIAGK